MPRNEGLRQHLLTRRSLSQTFLAEPGPTPAELHEMFTMAMRVPDHGKLNPWRLVLYAGEARTRVGEKLADIAKARNPEIDEAGLENERKQFLPAPLTVGVISTAAPHVKIPEFEQLLAAGNVCLNLVHAAHALGFGAQWVTRWYAYDDTAARMLGARPGERFVGFISIGTPTTTISDRVRPDVQSLVSTWQD